MFHVSGVTCQVSHFGCHMSGVSWTQNLNSKLYLDLCKYIFTLFCCKSNFVVTQFWFKNHSIILSCLVRFVLCPCPPIAASMSSVFCLNVLGLWHLCPLCVASMSSAFGSLSSVCSLNVVGLRPLCHLCVASMSSAFGLYVLCVLPQCPRLFASLSPVCCLPVLGLWPLCPLCVASMSLACGLSVSCVLPPCPCLVASLSSLCCLHVLGLLPFYPLYFASMSLACGLFVPCVLPQCTKCFMWTW